jgi:cytokinin dehydrogenase
LYRNYHPLRLSGDMPMSQVGFDNARERPSRGPSNPKECCMTANKRTVSGGGLACTAAFAGARPATSANAGRCDGLSVRGALARDAKDLAAAADDFGHIIHRRPQAVLKPASVADIAEAVRWAGDRGLKVAARGQGHSIYGRAMTNGGIVVDMSPMSRVLGVQTDRIVVEAGATWESVLNAALRQGLTPPVLTNYLGLSVGGTLAVGGIGAGTSSHGMQTDTVLELEAVTGDGRVLTCSQERNPGLFNAVRAGLGQCALITRAALRLVHAPERVRRFQLSYPSLRALTTDQRRVLEEDRFDQLQGAVLPDGDGGWRYQLEGAVLYQPTAPPDQEALLAGLLDDRSVAVVSDLTYLEDANAFARLETLLRSNRQWFHPHPWLLTFLPGSNAESIATEILAGLANADIGPFGRVTYYPMRTGAVRTPLVRMPTDRIAFPFNIVRFPVSKDITAAERMVAKNRALYERIGRAGGVLYPVSAFPMSPREWKGHFGPMWELLHEAKQQYDPRHTLTPGYEIASPGCR